MRQLRFEASKAAADLEVSFAGGLRGACHERWRTRVAARPAAPAARELAGATGDRRLTVSDEELPARAHALFAAIGDAIAVGERADALATAYLAFVGTGARDVRASCAAIGDDDCVRFELEAILQLDPELEIPVRGNIRVDRRVSTIVGGMSGGRDGHHLSATLGVTRRRAY
jgi:hypothetical protein